MKRSNLYTLLGCFLALGLGGAAGSLRSSSQNTAPAPSAVTMPMIGTAQTPLPSSQIEVNEALAQSMKTETGAKRWLTMFSALEQAGSFEMQGLIRAAGNDPAMLRVLATRWAEIDPEGMFRAIHADCLLPEGSPAAFPHRWILSSVLFENWIKRDTAAVIASVGKASDFPGLQSLKMSVINQLMRSDAEKGLKTMAEWDIRNYLPDMKSVEEWAAQEPRRAAELIAQMESNHTGLEALKHVGKAWAQSDPSGALRFAASLNPNQRAALAEEIMRAWAGRDLTSAIAAATAESDPLMRAALAPGLVQTWGQSNPSAALAWSQKELRGAARTEAIAGIIKVTAEKSLQTASELVADMEPGAAQNGACASIFETWFQKGEGERSAAFEWLASLPDEAARDAALEKVQWNWAWKEPEAVRDFIEGPHGHLASRSLIHQVARNQTARNPEAAMQWASQLPGERAKQTQEAVLDHWLNVRPEGAMEYARALPAGDQREKAIRSISQNLIFQAPAQAIKWYENLTSTEKQAMREMVKRSGISDSNRAQLEAAMDGQ